MRKLGDLDICKKCGAYRKHHRPDNTNPHKFVPYEEMFSAPFTDPHSGKSYRFQLRDNASTFEGLGGGLPSYQPRKAARSKRKERVGFDLGL